MRGRLDVSSAVVIDEILMRDLMTLIQAVLTWSHRAGSSLPASLFLLLGLGLPAATPVITRGPYLQSLTTTSVVVRWRTDVAVESRVRYGTDSTELNDSAAMTNATTEHIVSLARLDPDTRYFYALQANGQTLLESINLFFITAPVTNRPVRIWVIGDSGTGDINAMLVRDTFYAYASNRYTDVWLALGDNAYVSGTDADYQRTFFNIYGDLLRQTAIWPALGNHDGDFTTGNIPFLDIFSLPTEGEAGGVPSRSERYYAFDYANIHFVCLDPVSSDMSTNGVMLQWLRADLAANTNEWLIACLHYPPYTEASHLSDTELDLRQVRERIVPLLEDFGTDLVLAGHSHSYERSFLLNGHYGPSSTLMTNMVIDGSCTLYRKPAAGLGIRRGTVYVVAGSSGQLGGGDLDHPVMCTSLNELGSVVIDVDSLRMNVKFLRDEGGIGDSFTISKEDWPESPRPKLSASRTGTNLLLAWPTSIPPFDLHSARSGMGTWTPVTNVPTMQPRELRVQLPISHSPEFFHLRKRQP